jgi:hypothetical protein
MKKNEEERRRTKKNEERGARIDYFRFDLILTLIYGNM